MKRILLQLDCGPAASVFDSVVAVDAGADVLLQRSGVTPGNVESHVHGCIFTRGPKDLHNTALFLGGDDVPAVDAAAEAVRGTFFGPMRVSVLVDPNGSNTTAAAAVRLASGHAAADAPAVVLGSGPVGGRVARMCASRGRPVTILGRDAGRSQEAADVVARTLAAKDVNAAAVSGTAYGTAEAEDALRSGDLLFACGKAGVELLPNWSEYGFGVAVDLNAVPPAGLPGIEAGDFGEDRGGTRCYGAIGVGGPKMKLHKAAVRSLFETNDRFLDAEEVLTLADDLIGG